MSSPPDPAAKPTEPEDERDSLWQTARMHPFASATLVTSMLAGAVICGLFLPESISMPRRIMGGGIGGGLSWLLVMVGRVLD